MPILYGEITCVLNDENSFTNMLMSWLNLEIIDHTNSKIVILFEDGEICEMNDKLKDFQYEFSHDNTHVMPIYFEKNITNESTSKQIYFKKEPIYKEGKNRLYFKNLFNSHKSYLLNYQSVFNCIYYCNILNNNLKLDTSDVFGLLHIKSAESKPRFMFAYDSDEFSKEEVIYILNYIFKK